MELGKAQEKAGKELEKRGYSTTVPPATGTYSGSYVCASCGAAFNNAPELNRHK
jgi:hypothetical protein